MESAYGWDICYYLAPEEYRQQVQKDLPGAIFHANKEAVRGMPARRLQEMSTAPLDAELLYGLAAHESTLLKMLDRWNWDSSWDYRKRIDYYHNQLMYWIAVLRKLEPDVAVFRSEPHNCYDYVLYALCCHWNINTVILQRTAVPGRLLLVHRLDEGSEALRKAYAAQVAEPEASPSVSTDIATHMDRLANAPYQQAMPFHLQHKLKVFGLDDNQIVTTIHMLRGVLKGLLMYRHDKNVLRRVVYGWRGKLKRRQLRKLYRQLTAENVDLERPYIFVALQCDPERQVSPNGGIFAHQHLMVTLLSRCAPEGWSVYVKEHTSQFRDYQRVERAKTGAFYRYLDTLANVTLVPLSINSFELIDKAKAVATVSGTVGWEAVVRGKPALLFGHAWYRDCPGVYRSTTEHSLRETLDQIAKGIAPDPWALRAFAAGLGEASVLGVVDKIYAELGMLSEEDSISSIAASLDTFCQRAGGARYSRQGAAARDLNIIPG
jgi:hypothetical protein